MRTRTLAIPFLAAAALFVSAIVTAPAFAGTYTVRSCSNQATSPASAVKGADDAWQRDPDPAPAYIQFARACPPFAEDPLGGLLVRDFLTVDGAPAPSGAFAEYRFDAPAGTTLTSLTLWRQIGKRNPAWELYTSADGTKLPASDCTPPAGATTCEIGGVGAAPGEWTGLSASSLRVGIRCTAATCPTGNNQAWTAIYGSVVTVDDPTPPTAAASGPLATSQYIGGTVPGTVASATDGSGIQRLELLVDGQRVADRLRPCDFTRRAPCTNITTPESLALPTATMAEGEHTVELRAFDAGGNFAPVTSRTVTVDNTAPAAPTPASPTSLTVSTPAANIAWTAPDGELAPITTAHIQVCGPFACTTQQTPAATGTATVGLTQGAGRYVVSVSLEDAAGNRNPANSAAWTVDFTPPPAAAPATARAVPPPVPGQQVLGRADRTPRPRVSPGLVLARPTVARDRRTIAVRGSVAAGVTGTVTVTASARIRGRTRTVTRRAAIRRGRYRVNLRLPSTRWRTAKVTVRFPRSATRTAAQVTRTVRQRSR